MKTQHCFILYALIATVVSCQRNSPPVGDTNRNALDWQGVYHGILPCADCPGILATIQLNEDNTFTLSFFYPGKSDARQERTGSFAWDESGSRITLKGLNGSVPPVYKVGENRLMPVHDSITNAGGDHYILTKGGNEITNRYWRLVQLNDKPVARYERQRNEPHLILLAPDSTAIGNASCNSFRGTYEMKASNRISFSPLAATKMACMESMEVEDQFLKTLSEVRGYEVASDSLFLLNEAGARTAGFTLTNQ